MVLTVGLFDMDMSGGGDASSTMEGVKDDSLEEDFFFEHDSSALCTSLKSSHYPTLDSEALGQTLECVNQVGLSKSLEAEGKVNCTKLQYGLTMAETKKEDSLVVESETPFRVEECFDYSSHSKIVDKDDDNWFNHNLLFFSKQSSEVLDTMNPETFPKCSDAEILNCRNKLQDNSDIETELNLIGDPEFDQMPFWSTLTDKLEYPDHVETHPICCHKVVEQRTKQVKQNAKTEFCEKYYFLEEKEQSTNLTDTESDSKVQDQLMNTNIPNLRKSEANKRFSNVTGQLYLGYDPQIDISTTYLYSTKEAQVWQDNEEAVFPTGVIPLMGSLRTFGKLMNGAPCRTLFDSGATSVNISTTFYKQNKILHSYPKYSIPKITVKIADDSIMTATEAVKIVVNLRGHVFEIIAYLLDLGDSLDLIFGVK